MQGNKRGAPYSRDMDAVRSKDQRRNETVAVPARQAGQAKQAHRLVGVQGGADPITTPWGTCSNKEISGEGVSSCQRLLGPHFSIQMFFFVRPALAMPFQLSASATQALERPPRSAAPRPHMEHALRAKHHSRAGAARGARTRTCR